MSKFIVMWSETGIYSEKNMKIFESRDPAQWFAKDIQRVYNYVKINIYQIFFAFTIYFSRSAYKIALFVGLKDRECMIYLNVHPIIFKYKSKNMSKKITLYNYDKSNTEFEKK